MHRHLRAIWQYVVLTRQSNWGSWGCPKDWEPSVCDFARWGSPKTVPTALLWVRVPTHGCPILALRANKDRVVQVLAGILRRTFEMLRNAQMRKASGCQQREDLFPGWVRREANMKPPLHFGKRKAATPGLSPNWGSKERRETHEVLNSRKRFVRPVLPKFQQILADQQGFHAHAKILRSSTVASTSATPAAKCE